MNWTKDIVDILTEKNIALSYWGHKGGIGLFPHKGNISDENLLNILTGN